MQVKLYITKSAPNVLEKVLDNELELNGTLRDGSSILTPVLVLNRGQGITQYNYAYVGAFGRYYYISKITSLQNNLWEVAMSVDPLMSWSSQIRKIPAICSRSSTVFNRYLVDSEYQNDARALVQYKQIGSFEGVVPIILVMGGDNSDG